MIAFVTGINGMDGSHITELLLSKGYEVHGLIRRTSQPLMSHIEHFKDKITLHPGDMTDGGSIYNAIEKCKPDEIYNLAAMSQVRWSFEVPSMTMDVNCNGFLRVVEAVRSLKLDCKIYQACSSEMFGKVLEIPQTETTPFNPQSPYGVSKAAACHMARVYRRSYGMKIYCGILFNHEGPRRGQEFLSRTVAMGVAAIVNKAQDKLVIGNMEAKRDFGYAPEYVEWIWRIMQHDTPDDFVIATGETHSVREFVVEAFKCVGIEDWEQYVSYNKALARPAEVDLLIGDFTKSKQILGFEPKVKFKELVKIMVDAEMAKYNVKHSFGHIK